MIRRTFMLRIRNLLVETDLIHGFSQGTNLSECGDNLPEVLALIALRTLARHGNGDQGGWQRG